MMILEEIDGVNLEITENIDGTRKVDILFEDSNTTLTFMSVNVIDGVVAKVEKIEEVVDKND